LSSGKFSICSSNAVGRNKRSALRRSISNTRAEATLYGDVAGSILRKQFRPYVAMKRRMRPIADAGNQPVLDWIDVTILDVASA
jgi:hypothetical protein